jgi:hypothetical protein
MGTIQEIGQHIKGFFREKREELYMSGVIILVALLAFGLGRLSVIYGETGEFKVVYPENPQNTVE